MLQRNRAGRAPTLVFTRPWRGPTRRWDHLVSGCLTIASCSIERYTSAAWCGVHFADCFASHSLANAAKLFSTESRRARLSKRRASVGLVPATSSARASSRATGVSQVDPWVLAEHQHGCFAEVPVAIAPELGSSGRNFDAEAARVSYTIEGRARE